MQLKMLNNIKGFSWASKPRSDEPYAKVSLCGESFWIKDCEPYGGNSYLGVVDNDVCGTHGLKLGDSVVFTPTDSLEKHNWTDSLGSTG